ncbi:MAG: DsbA family protein [Planktotalea sp.]|uniref:DsbA family protein n=1 Tax=Planktotalea sp. TaxID=2029877 RepID=UPI002610EE87|nr:DsbA family protein [Planktotalea sp.]MDG1075096.1 DsbA family protein [Planktotalea sp.]
MATAQEGDIADMVQGSPDAKVEIIEYASYTCPHCASFHAGPYKDLKKDYVDTGKVKFVFREVYFDRFGLWASMIARCAGPDRFFGMTDLLFKEQSLWSRAGDPAAIVAELRKIGLKGGMEEAQLNACLEDADNAQALVAWYQENAERDDVGSTPSFLINGEPYSNMNYADFSAIIEENLAE